MPKKTGLANAIKKPVNPEEWVKEKPMSTTTTEKPVHLVVKIPAELHRPI